MHADTARTLTHDDLASHVGVSVTTIKSYRRKFPGFIRVASHGKPIRFRPEALEACLLIRSSFEKGASVRETRKKLEQAGFTEDRGSMPEPAGPPGHEERLQELLSAAGEMMQSVARLAEAQQLTDQRLARLEEGLARLTTLDAENKALLARLGPLSERAAPQPEPEPEPEPSPRKMRAKKIVNVRTASGGVDSYALGDEDADPFAPDGSGRSGRPVGGSETPAAPAASATGDDVPPPELLDRPVAIRSEDGEYLGLPGKLSLRELVAFLLDRGRDTGEVGAAWLRDGNGWRAHIDYGDGRSRGLTFMSQTTPTGVRLALLTRLIMDGVEVSTGRRMEYFRQLKNQQPG